MRFCYLPLQKHTKPTNSLQFCLKKIFMSKLNVGDNMFNFISLIIIIVGAINWFCIGVFQFDLIAGIFGTQSHFFSRFIYTIIGLAGLWFLAYTLIKKGQLSLLPQKAKKSKTDSMRNENAKDSVNTTLEDNITSDTRTTKSEESSVDSKDISNKQNATTSPQNITLTISNDTPSSNSISNKSSNISTPKSTTKKRTTKKKNITLNN